MFETREPETLQESLASTIEIHEQSSERVMPPSIGNVFRYRSPGVCYEGGALQ